MSKNQKNIDISVKSIEYTPANDFTSSQLNLEFTGKEANLVITNTIRRVAYDDIPSYAFDYINIEFNNSVFNNDMMTIHLRQLPIYDIDTGLYFLHPVYWKDVDYSNKNREKHHKEILIEGIVNVYNTTDEIRNVTTNDITYYVDTIQTKYQHKGSEPILLIQLRPNETFKCQIKGCLGVGERDSIWSMAHSYHHELESNKILFTMESMGQMIEHDIIIKCCKLIKMKLNLIKKEIETRVNTKEILHNHTIFFDIDNEDFTMGNLINNCLQDHENIVFSGISKPDHLVKSIKFKITSSPDIISPIEPFYDAIDHLVNLYDEIEKQVISIKKKANLPDLPDYDEIHKDADNNKNFDQNKYRNKINKVSKINKIKL
jgi:DNA-directed RNA polymerase subunit L